MLVGAALECLWTTFEAIARREALTVDDWSGTAHGVLDRGPAGPQFTSITLAVAMTVDAPDEARARTLLEKAERTCIISRALAVPITLDVAITCRGIAHAGSTRTEPQEGAHECSRIDDHATSHVSRQ